MASRAGAIARSSVKVQDSGRTHRTCTLRLVRTFEPRSPSLALRGSSWRSTPHYAKRQEGQEESRRTVLGDCGNPEVPPEAAEPFNLIASPAEFVVELGEFVVELGDFDVELGDMDAEFGDMNFGWMISVKIMVGIPLALEP